MKDIQRNIPNFEKNRVANLLLRDQAYTLENYVACMQKREIKMEEEIRDLLYKVGIQASTKTERYSLPHAFEIQNTMQASSFINDALDMRFFYRAVLQELLGKNFYKIRFYVFMELSDKALLGAASYYFRYYVHE